MEAGNEFSYGRYERVVSLLRDLVERDLLRERDDRLEALRLYGICLYLTGRRAAAGEIFRTLLRLEPEARLDPRLVQPEVVAAFEILRKEQAKGLQERARQELRRRHGIAAALPPWGQFQNGHWQKGAAVLGLELVFLGANIGSYYALRSDRLRQPDRTYVEKDAQGNVVKDHRALAKALMAVNATSFALLLGTVVYGIVDGAVYHVRHRKRLKRLLGEGASLMAAPAPGGGAVCLTLQF